MKEFDIIENEEKQNKVYSLDEQKNDFYVVEKEKDEMMIILDFMIYLLKKFICLIIYFHM